MACLVSCNSSPSIEIALEQSGNNRAEWEHLLHTYENENDKQKAVRFLIGNMSGKGWYAGRIIDKYQEIFDTIVLLRGKGMSAVTLENELKDRWSRAMKLYGIPSMSKTGFYPDLRYLPADDLKKNIDRVFVLRDSLPWCKQLNKNLFYQYVLPHRIADECPSNWREYLYRRTQTLRDTARYDNAWQLAAVLNRYINTYIGTSRTLWNYPFAFAPRQIEALGTGACQHRVLYTAMMMRANGLPVTIDYTPRWANRSAKHFWNVLIGDNGEKNYPFDGAQPGFELAIPGRKLAKVLRKEYAADPLPLADHPDIPAGMIGPGETDVTHEYVKTYDITVPLTILRDDKIEYALICTFDNKNWEPQYWGRIKGNKAYFKNMGTDVVYMPMYHRKGIIQPAGEPFLLDSTGNINYFTPRFEERIDLITWRKYPMDQRMETMMGYMVGGQFVGSDRPDHSDTVLLFKVGKRPEKFETALINQSRPFRYVRYVTDRVRQEHVAEIEFYGLSDQGDTVKLNGKVIGYPEFPAEVKTPYMNVFDGNTESFFLAPGTKKPWVGMDFGNPQHIVKIRYCPRSDTNFIEDGHIYELCYWHEGEWATAEEQTANEQKLIFRNVPSGCLYILHDHTKGKEERIFTYENEKQVWW